MSDLPQTGVTVRAHVQHLLAEAIEAIGLVLAFTFTKRRPRAAQREQLRRDLAGVIATCETVRIWLDKGAPQ